jgi:hypothetical protein
VQGSGDRLGPTEEIDMTHPSKEEVRRARSDVSPLILIMAATLIGWLVEHIARIWLDPLVAAGVAFLVGLGSLVGLLAFAIWFRWATDEDGGW